MSGVLGFPVRDIATLGQEGRATKTTKGLERVSHGERVRELENTEERKDCSCLPSCLNTLLSKACAVSGVSSTVICYLLNYRDTVQAAQAYSRAVSGA